MKCRVNKCTIIAFLTKDSLLKMFIYEPRDSILRGTRLYSGIVLIFFQ